MPMRSKAARSLRMATPVQTEPEAVRELRRRLAAAVRKHLAPPARLSVAEWAERYRFLSREEAADPGPWRTERVPYLREIMDAISNPDIEEMVIMKASQIGATVGIIGNGLGYFVDQDPAPLLVVQPSEGDAEDWSKTKLAPMIADTPRLAERFSEPRSRSSDNTILTKSFPGGFLKIVGATSPKGLRRTSARIAFLDEVDAYPASAGAEGDPVRLVAKRLTTFWNRKLILMSSPTLKGLSRIEKAFGNSDQRYYHVPCPHCGAYQVLRWGGPETDYGIKWERDNPDTASYQCVECGRLIDERHKPEMVAAGHWLPENPGARTPGWHISALISLFDGARWAKLVLEFLEAKDDPELLKVWVNTVVAEPWEERSIRIEPQELAGRAEAYAAEVPSGVGLLTAGVDIQVDRLELLVRGWGAGQESWGIAHHRIHGDPELEEPWQRLEALLVRPYRHESGAELRIQSVMIDARYKMDTVYAFVRPRERRNVFGATGAERLGREPMTRATKKNRYGVKPFTISTVSFKDTLFSRLSLQRPGPRYMHYPKATPDGGFDAEFYAQLAAEKPVRERVRGRLVRRYKQTRTRNEAIDLEVLNLAALHALGAGIREQLAGLARRVQTSARPAGTAAPGPVSRAQHPPGGHLLPGRRRAALVRDSGPWPAFPGAHRLPAVPPAPSRAAAGRAVSRARHRVAEAAQRVQRGRAHGRRRLGDVHRVHQSRGRGGPRADRRQRPESAGGE